MTQLLSPCWTDGFSGYDALQFTVQYIKEIKTAFITTTS